MILSDISTATEYQESTKVNRISKSTEHLRRSRTFPTSPKAHLSIQLIADRDLNHSPPTHIEHSNATLRTVTHCTETATSSQAKLASKWIKDCASNHPLCQSTSPLPPKLPPRVIDVLNREEPYLFETGEQIGEYATLSYCWGAGVRNLNMATFGPHSKGRRGLPNPKPNIESHKKAIPFSSMPPTLQDAVTFCRQLKVQYLWIDAFCIVQGDEEEWRSVNPRMADMYANAKFTICADSADGLGSGFLRIRSRCRPSAGMGICPATNEQVNLSLSPLLLPDPLNDRAWALSEAIFSNRAIHFTSRGLIWECNQVRRSEDGRSFALSSDNKNHSSPTPSSFRIFRNISLAKQLTPSKDNLYRLWGTVITHFTRRQINSNLADRYKDDQRLVALHRVSRRFADILKEIFGVEDVYLAGIWKGDLARGLAWGIEAPGTPGDSNYQLMGPARWRRPAAVRAPSWSWAAIEGPVWSCVQRSYKGFESAVSISEASTECVDYREPFSQVRGGRLVLIGRVVHGLRCVPGERSGRNDGDGDSMAGHRCRVVSPKMKDGLSFVCDVGMEEVDGTDLSCLFLGRGYGEMGTGTYSVFLLLKQADGEFENTFQRVGISSLGTGSEDAGQLLETAHEGLVEIV